MTVDKIIKGESFLGHSIVLFCYHYITEFMLDFNVEFEYLTGSVLIQYFVMHVGCTLSVVLGT